MLLARAADARIVAADLGRRPPVLLDRCEVVRSMIAVRPMHVTMMIMIVIMVAIGAVDVTLRLGRGAVVGVGSHQGA